MPTIDKLYLLKILVCVLLLTGTLVGVHTLQASRIPDAIRRQAERAVETEKLDAAIRYYRQYLEFRKDDLDVREKLAECMRNRGGDARTQLRSLYEEILRNDPSRTAIRKEALKVALSLGRYSDAESHGEILLKTDSQDSELWQQMGIAQAGLRKFDRAKTSFETAVKLAPQDPLAYQRLWQFLVKDLDQYAEARKIIDRMVTAMPNSAEPRITRAKFLLRTTESSAAVPPIDKDPVLADLTFALEKEPSNADALLLKAERLQRHRDITSARSNLLEGLRHHPSNVRLVRALAWLEMNRGDTNAAINVLEESLPNVKDSLEVLVPLADLLLQMGDLNKTEEIVKRLEKQPSPKAKLPAKYLRARVLMRQFQWDDAIQLLQEIRSAAIELPGLETQANLLLASCYQRKGNSAKEIESLKLITSKESGHLTAHALLGGSYLNVGQFADALREDELAMQSPESNESHVIAYARLRATSMVVAGAGIDAWQKFDRWLEELAPRFRANPAELALLRADVMRLSANRKRALEIVEQELKRSADARLWVKRAELEADLHGVQAGLAVIEEAQGQGGDTVAFRLARAELYARDPARVRPLKSLERGIERWSDGDQDRLYYGLINIYDRLRDDKALLQLLQKMASRRNEIPLWLLLAERSLQANDQERFTLARSRIEKWDGGDRGNLLIVDAWNALQKKQNLAEYSQKIVKQWGESPDRADACMLLARIAEQQGDSTTAGKYYTRAAMLEPTKLEPMLANVAYLARSGAMPAVTKQLTRVMNDSRWSGEPLQRLVSATLKETAPESRSQILTLVQGYFHRQPGGLGALADALAAKGLTAESQRLAELAVQTPSANIEDWLRILLVKPERIADAQKSLSPTLMTILNATVAEVPQIAEKIAVNTKMPERLFTQTRLAIRQTQSDRSGAIELLDGYLKQSSVSKVDQTWAKRNLAMLLMVRGEAEDRKRAMTVLTKNITVAELSVEEQRSLITVLFSLARYLDPKERDEAMAVSLKWAETLAQTTKSPRDEFAICRFQRTLGHTKEAVEQLNTLLATDATNPEYLQFGLGILVEAKQYDSAKPFADRLLALSPNDLGVLSAVCRYEAAAGRPERAFTLLETLLKTPEPRIPEDQARSRRVAELLDELARKPELAKNPIRTKMAEKAATLYESLVASQGDAVVPLVALVTTMPPASEDAVSTGLAKIDKLSRILTTRMKAIAGVTVLRIASGSQRQMERVEGWLDVARQENPDSSSVWMAEAEFRLMKQDFTAAEKAYEEILKRDPENVQALNNLAWILAPQPRAAERALELIDRAVKEIGMTGELLDTRARVRIAAKQLELAEKDAAEALSQQRTPLRYFHLALALNEQRPPRAAEAEKAFHQAMEQGLTAKSIHPFDVPTYRVFENTMK